MWPLQTARPRQAHLSEPARRQWHLRIVRNDGIVVNVGTPEQEASGAAARAAAGSQEAAPRYIGRRTDHAGPPRGSAVGSRVVVV